MRSRSYFKILFLLFITALFVAEDLQMCEFKDEDDCVFHFSYYYMDNDLKILAQGKKG